MDKLFALIKKEFFQIVRDPSSIIIAFVLPAMLLLIYMYGVNMDTARVALGIKVEDTNPEISTLVASFNNSDYINPTVYTDRQQMYNDLRRGKIKGFVVIPNDFSAQLEKKQPAHMQIVTDGSEVNTSNYAMAYPVTIANQWLATSSKYKYTNSQPIISPEIRYWFNQDINSHHFILPGSLAITMTLIGILLTALVVAREWERGTMEALLATRVTRIQIVLSKYIPYFILGMISMSFNVFMCVAVFEIPFRGSYFILFAGTALFLFTALGIGLLISTNFKDQFLASQTALVMGFLPALMLSGLIFPITSMPTALQYFTRIVPTRYFVPLIQTEFLTGTVQKIVFENFSFLFVFGLLLFIAVYKKTQMRLD